MPGTPTSEPESDFVCDCEQWKRSACSTEPFYGEYEGKHYCVLHFQGTEKILDFAAVVQRKLDNKDFNFRGVWFPAKLRFELEFDLAADFSGATFTTDAFFIGSSFRARVDFSGASFGSNAYFSRATFSEAASFHFAEFRGGAYFTVANFKGAANFTSAKFSGAADFSHAMFTEIATFSETTFSLWTSFQSATFGATANFNDARLSDADFRTTNFNSSAFFKAKFRSNADFSSAKFAGESDFGNAIFESGVRFKDVSFEDRVRFAGADAQPIFSKTSSLDLQFARIEAPDRVSFHTLILRPNWFVNVNAREFDFTNVDWDWRRVETEIHSMKERQISSPYRLLCIACRHLAVNAEENHRYEEASKFRYMAMETRRLESWRGFAPWRLSWWYWLASGYGERVWQAFFVLLGILLLSALFYNHVGFVRWEAKVASESDVAVAKRDNIGAPLKFSRALTYSAGVMILQKPEPRPATTAAQTVVLIETILGPVQAALLALAIRRKFMR